MAWTPSFSGSVFDTPSFDAFFDELPPSSCNLPPLELHDAFPASSTTSRQPSPLEPQANTCVMPEQETFFFSNRQQALAEAKPLDACELNELEALTPAIATDPPAQEPRTVLQNPRKKHKLYEHEQIADFVHLPKPQVKAREELKPPFRPIAVLQQLHEPPPSAALFPPIIPSASQEDDGEVVPGKRQSKGAVGGEKSQDINPTKRVYSRKRTKWTEQETEELVKGVAIYGVGRWKHILDHPDLNFNEKRTSGDLKDRFRVCFPPNAPAKWVMKLPEEHSDSADETLGPSAAVCPIPKRRARKRAWTEAEDEELEEGFRRYGYQWKLIAKDQTLQFDDRSGNQVRDRFRLRFPRHYAQESRPPQPRRRSSKKKNPAESKNKNEAVEGTAQHPQHDDSVIGSQWTNPFGPNAMLNGDEDDTETRLSNALTQYNSNESLTLAPIAWEDMVPQPMFDFV